MGLYKSREQHSFALFCEVRFLIQDNWFKVTQQF